VVTDLRKLGAVQEAGGWARMGTRPGPVMWSLAFMRIEKVYRGRPMWRAWDTLRVSDVRLMHPTTLHKTLKAAKAHCESVVNGVAPQGVR
jgi:hypothetical protein